MGWKIAWAVFVLMWLAKLSSAVACTAATSTDRIDLVFPACVWADETKFPKEIQVDVDGWPKSVWAVRSGNGIWTLRNPPYTITKSKLIRPRICIPGIACQTASAIKPDPSDKDKCRIEYEFECKPQPMWHVAVLKLPEYFYAVTVNRKTTPTQLCAKPEIHEVTPANVCALNPNETVEIEINRRAQNGEFETLFKYPLSYSQATKPGHKINLGPADIDKLSNGKAARYTKITNSAVQATTLTSVTFVVSQP